MTKLINPIATPEQHAVEQRALEFMQKPAIAATIAEIREYWLDKVRPTGGMRRRFDDAFEEVMFGALVWSLNQDPLYPTIVTITRLAHKVGNLDVPGSRWGVDNPDSIYRVIPISGDEKYLIHGRVPSKRLTENYFTLWDGSMGTVDVLNGKNLEVDQEGYFTITVDSDPVDGRGNHIRSSPTAREFFIRDVLLDWAEDRPNELSIERLGPEPSRPPLSESKQIELSSQYMWDWVGHNIRWNNQALDGAANQFDFTIDRDTDGALGDQIYVMSRFDLGGNDKALVFTVELGGAAYFIAPITNYWATTNGIVDRNGSLNKHQSVANADGTYTYVVSVLDPGVHNWLDPSDMHEGILTLRWAEFESAGAGASLSVNGKLVPLAELDQHLPPDTARLSVEARAAQLRERAASYHWRLLDH